MLFIRYKVGAQLNNNNLNNAEIDALATTLTPFSRHSFTLINDFEDLSWLCLNVIPQTQKMKVTK